MKYQDDLSNGRVNGFQVGVRIGTPTPDGLNPTDDGYDYLRGIEHTGTVMQDGHPNAINPTPKEE